MIKREHYIKPIRSFYDSDLIKIITGIRRCGKSVVLSEIWDEIKNKSDNIISLDFEDAAILETLPDCNSLLQHIESNRKTGLCYVFLDEVQRVDRWADACRTLRLRECSVFISGSNAKLLSSEFTKELSGRYVAFRIRPFVYKEILQYASELRRDVPITDYLVWGGFPQRFEFSDTDAQRRYLNDLNETIILNDIIGRYRIRKTQLFKKLAKYVFISNARIFSAHSVCDYLTSNGETCSIATVVKYIGYLEEAYALESIRQYSTKAKQELNYYRKTYNADVALNSIHCLNNRFDLTHNLENIVYNELIYMKYDLMVYNNAGREIDFLAQKDGKKYFIQVAYSVMEEKTYTREFSAFANIDNLSQKILITNDELDYSTSVVRHIKLKDFLLMESL
jgi:hypothetical protein